MPYEDGHDRTRARRRGKVTAVALIVAAAAVLATVATAGPTAATQRVEITQGGDGAFVLTPLTSGTIKRDTGAFAACCWGRRFVTRAGESIEIDDPQITLSGKRGTIVARNRIEFVGITDGDAVFTGTWKVVRATGAYAGLTGGGRLGGVQRADGTAKSVFQGFLGPK